MPLGRRDSLTASKAAVANSLPAPTSNISTLISKFKDVGLTENDLVTLSGCPIYISIYLYKIHLNTLSILATQRIKSVKGKRLITTLKDMNCVKDQEIYMCVGCVGLI